MATQHAATTTQRAVKRARPAARRWDARGPYITVPDGLPGILGLLASKPASASKIGELAEQLMRGPSPLSPTERETIAAFVSSRNDCYFCSRAHAAIAAQLPDGDRETVCAVIDDLDAAPVSERMRALLRIAANVQRSGKAVTPDDIAQARAAGADDEHIHDAVLVAAAFCMFNRYVDGLAAITPTDAAIYDEIGSLIARRGYAHA
jgi:uncharacterized peroxidase-related enzyme